MRIVDEFYIDFEHQPEEGWSRVLMFKTEDNSLVGERSSSVYYTDRFSRKGGRRACMFKLLDPKTGVFPGDDNKNLRTYIWKGYWKVMPQDKRL